MIFWVVGVATGYGGVRFFTLKTGISFHWEKRCFLQLNVRKGPLRLAGH